jgi:hypothetical protein
MIKAKLIPTICPGCGKEIAPLKGKVTHFPPSYEYVCPNPECENKPDIRLSTESGHS